MIYPIGDRILVKIKKPEEASSGGIILTTGAQEQKNEGTIISVGSLVTQLEIGNYVLFGKFSGDEMMVDGEKHRIMKEYDVIAVQN